MSESLGLAHGIANVWHALYQMQSSDIAALTYAAAAAATAAAAQRLGPTESVSKKL